MTAPDNMDESIVSQRYNVDMNISNISKRSSQANFEEKIWATTFSFVLEGEGKSGIFKILVMLYAVT